MQDTRATITKDAAMTSRANEDETGSGGMSPQAAINVKAVPDEYAWLDQHYPGYQFVKQALCWRVRGWLDVIDIVTASGEERTIYFQLTRGMLGR